MAVNHTVWMKFRDGVDDARIAAHLQALRLIEGRIPGVQSLTLGRNFTDAEAVDLGLAHETAEVEGFEATCLARLEEFADKDALALATTKAWLRESVLAEMMTQEGERVGAFLDGWFSEGTQERIRATVAALQAKG